MQCSYECHQQSCDTLVQQGRCGALSGQYATVAVVQERRSTRSSARVGCGTENKRAVEDRGNDIVTTNNEVQKYAECEVNTTITHSAYLYY